MDNNFYVYEWFNVETKEIFYVGKGNSNRFKNISQRNQYFKNYYNKYDCEVRKVKDNLSEEEAFKLEKELIEKYRNLNQCQCNLTDGGEGCTFPKGSWNDMFRKLQYLHDVKGSMDDMEDEEDYDPNFLKTKSLEELNELYENFINYKEGIRAFNNLVYDKKGNVNDGYEEFDSLAMRFDPKHMTEMSFQFQEVDMLSKLIAEKIAKEDKQFKKYLDCKTEIDFMCLNINTDKFISLMIQETEYYGEVLKCISDNLQLLKIMGKLNRFNLHIKLRSFKFKDNKIIIRFYTIDNYSTRKVSIDIYDIIWGILIFDNKPMFQLIYEEIFSAPFIN